MLGHKNRFSKKSLLLLERKARISFSDLSYLELSRLLDSLILTHEEDSKEIFYLRAKLAIILSDLEFFSELNMKKYNINERFLGFSIWYSYSLILNNNTDLAKKKLYLVKGRIKYNDFLLYGDFHLVLQRLYFETSKYSHLKQLYKNITEYLHFLPENSNFTKLGIYQLTILTYQVLGKESKAKKLLSKVFAENSCISEPYQYSKLLNLAGTFSRNSGSYVEAKKYFTRSLNISRFLKDKIGEASRISSLGHVEYYLGEFEQSLKYFIIAKELNASIKNILGLARSEYSMGNVLEKLGRSEEAITEYESSLSLFKDSNNKIGVLKVYNGLGMLFLMKGKDSKAHYFFKEALGIAQELFLPNDEASLYNNIGFLYQRKGNFNKSTKYLFKALEIYTTKNSYSRQKTILNIVENYRLLGRFNDALNFANNNLKLRSDEKEYTAFLKLKISTILFDLGKLNEAKIFAQEALQIFEQTYSPINIGISKRVIGRIYFVMGKTKIALGELKENLTSLSKNQLYGEIYQSSILDIIEIYLNLKELNKAKEWQNSLLKNSQDNKVKISRIIKANLNFLSYHNDFLSLKLNFEDFEKFTKFVESNNYFELKIKCLILKISYKIQQNDWKGALQLIEHGQNISIKKNLIILQIDTALLTGLLETNRYNFDKARSSCNKILNLINENGLDAYKSKAISILKLINNSEENIKSLYNLVKVKNNDKAEDDLLVSKESILEYLNNSLKRIRRNN